MLDSNEKKSESWQEHEGGVRDESFNLRREQWRMKMIPVNRPGMVTARKAKIVDNA